ncbi:MAG: phosphoenolpyruvate synthase [Saprospiraceae bacterium]|nr:phosphoenolpyruvate synthase [Saprospiraceae bacterium]
MSVRCLFLILLFNLPVNTARLFSQPKAPQEISAMIADFKKDVRGPYKDIRWFCKDGSINLPKEPCSEPGGHQRARYKDVVVELARSNHLFIGQILTTTPYPDFWDAPENHSRLKQYVLEKYLQSIDNGWVLNKAQFYRGAFQSEDEAAWGTGFLLWLLENDELLRDQYFLVKQTVKNIPHGQETKRSMNIRTLSKSISDSVPDFQNLRIKIHGQPEASDIEEVKKFSATHASILTAEQNDQLKQLIKELEITFKPIDLLKIRDMVKELPKDHPVALRIGTLISEYNDRSLDIDFAAKTAEMLSFIRQELLVKDTPKNRLHLLDLSSALEEIFLIESTKWHPVTVKDCIEKICFTGSAVMGAGYLEKWEWDQVAEALANGAQDQIELEHLQELVNTSNSVVQWGTGMVSATYKEVVNTFGEFEPLSYGFVDDQIRGSVLLPLGNAVGQLSDFVSQQVDLSNQVMQLSAQNRIRGLNPGIAKGRIEVIEGELPADVDPAKIYAFQSAPSDLKPVAGILTVNEGNMVSHVQLLARNLGIPNAIISSENLSELKAQAGEEVFYAVSPDGRVIMKPAEEMTASEKELFSVKKRSEAKITVPIEKIDLAQNSIINMQDIDASSSGIICGPKAANLAQLKAIFPEHVVDGIVLPFAIFRSHLDQQMPGRDQTYWQFLNSSFEAAEAMRNNDQATQATDFILEQLKILREAIQVMTLDETFIRNLEGKFEAVFGKTMGDIPVFLRSDTNMEDLKDFTGAGLNLTIFNVVKKEDIINGIRSVWASPYTERSFRWRQHYLLNPENVFPSILIIPSVDVDYSGVLISKGIKNGNSRDITVAFSRGAGGAVDGQAAESYLLHAGGENELIAPARELKYRSLPQSGGTDMHLAKFSQPILNAYNLEQLRNISTEIKKKMPHYLNLPDHAPLDVELGFKDNKIWLFQIRPFVENKNANTLDYLESISSEPDKNKIINTQSPL